VVARYQLGLVNISATPDLPHAIENHAHSVNALVSRRVKLLLQMVNDLHSRHPIELVRQRLKASHHKGLLLVPPVRVVALVGKNLAVDEDGMTVVLPIVENFVHPALPHAALVIVAPETLVGLGSDTHSRQALGAP